MYASSTPGPNGTVLNDSPLLHFIHSQASQGQSHHPNLPTSQSFIPSSSTFSSFLASSATFSSSFVLIEGNLKKRRTNSALGNLGLNVLKYQQFYFVLEQGFLSYYKDQKSRQHADAPLFRVAVHDIQSVSLPSGKASSSPGNRFLLTLRPSRDAPQSEQVLELLADSKSECDRWRQMLDLVLTQSRSGPVLGKEEDEEGGQQGKEAKHAHNKRELNESDLITPEPETVRDMEQFTISVALELVGPAADRISPLVVLYSPLSHDKPPANRTAHHSGSISSPGSSTSVDSHPQFPSADSLVTSGYGARFSIGSQQNRKDSSSAMSPSGSFAMSSSSSSSVSSPPSDLEVLLNHPSISSQLLDFCRSQHFEEYLLFYWEVQKYKKFYANQFSSGSSSGSSSSNAAPSSVDSSVKEEFALKCAQAIYEKFIKSGSEYELESNASQKSTVFQAIQSSSLTLNLFEMFEKKVLSDLRTEFLPKYIEKHGAIEAQLAALGDHAQAGGNSVIPAYTRKILGNFNSGFGVSTNSRCQKDLVIKGWEEICRTEVWPAFIPGKSGAGTAAAPPPLLVQQGSSRNLLGDGDSAPLLTPDAEGSVKAFRCLLSVPCDPALVSHTERRVNFMNKVKAANEEKEKEKDTKTSAGVGPPSLSRAATMTPNLVSPPPPPAVSDAEFHRYQPSPATVLSQMNVHAPPIPKKPASARGSIIEALSESNSTRSTSGSFASVSSVTPTRPSSYSLGRRLSRDDSSIPNRRSIHDRNEVLESIFLNARPPSGQTAALSPAGSQASAPTAGIGSGISALTGAISLSSMAASAKLRSRNGFIEDIQEGGDLKILRFHVYNVIDPNEEDVSKHQLLGGVQTTLRELLKAENGEILKNVTFIDTGMAASLRGAVSIMFQDKRRVKISSVPRFLYRSYIFRDVNGKDFIAHEQLEESPFTFTLPHAAIRRAVIDCKSMRKTVLDTVSEISSSKGKTAEDTKIRAELSNLLTYQAVEYNAAITKLEKLVKLFSNYNGEYRGFRFKPSKEKSNGPLSFIPINCHLQSFSVVRNCRHRTLKGIIKSDSSKAPGHAVAMVRNHAILHSNATLHPGAIKKPFAEAPANTAPPAVHVPLGSAAAASMFNHSSNRGLAASVANASDSMSHRDSAALESEAEDQFDPNRYSRDRSVVSVRPLSIKEIEAKLIYRPENAPAPVAPAPAPIPIPAAGPSSDDELQRLRLLDALANTGLISGMNPNMPISDDEDPKFRRIRKPMQIVEPINYTINTMQCVTVGAFVHHAFGLKQGGLLRQLQSLQEAQTKLDKEMEERERNQNSGNAKNEHFLIEPLKRVMDKMWNVQQRQIVVVSQAVTAFTTTLLSELLNSIDDHERWNRIAEIGFMAEMESLLSSFSNELYMLSDHFFACRTMENIQFTFSKLEGEETQPAANQLPTKDMDRIKLRLRVGGAAHLPTMALSLKHRFLKPRKLPRWARLSFSLDDDQFQVSVYRRLRDIFALGLNAEFQQFETPPFTPKVKLGKNPPEAEPQSRGSVSSSAPAPTSAAPEAVDYFELFNVNSHIAAIFVVEIQLPASLYSRLAPSFRPAAQAPANAVPAASSLQLPQRSGPSSSIIRALTETEDPISPESGTLTMQLEQNRIPLMKLTSEAAPSNLPRLAESHLESPAALAPSATSAVDPLFSGLSQAMVRTRLLAEEERKREVEEERRRQEEAKSNEAQRQQWIEAERRRRRLEGFEDEEEITTPLLSCVPILFTQGVNELQSVANKMGKTELQQEINLYAVKNLKRYFMAYCRHYINAGIQTQSLVIQEVIDDLQKLEHLIHAFHGEKNVALLLLANSIVRKLQGGRLICCKSAKDRTSMSVTYQQIRWLYEEHGLTDSDCALALGLFRLEGVRRFNVIKNTGAPAYAFNKLQRSLLPVPFRPPEQACSSSVDS